MKKVIFLNQKSNSYYTTDGEGENTKLVTVYINDISKAKPGVTKTNKPYYIIDCEERTSEKGNKYFKQI